MKTKQKKNKKYVVQNTCHKTVSRLENVMIELKSLHIKQSSLSCKMKQTCKQNIFSYLAKKQKCRGQERLWK